MVVPILPFLQGYHPESGFVIISGAQLKDKLETAKAKIQLAVGGLTKECANLNWLAKQFSAKPLMLSCAKDLYEYYYSLSKDIDECREYTVGLDFLYNLSKYK